ncbi:MAG: hypothetical protein ACLR17_03475 [Enterobacteriaceae bacterium]
MRWSFHFIIMELIPSPSLKVFAVPGPAVHDYPRNITGQPYISATAGTRADSNSPYCCAGVNNDIIFNDYGEDI